MSTTPYQLNFERKLIHHCSPTLAALKPANLFTCRDESVAMVRGNNFAHVSQHDFESAFSTALHAARTKLAPHGVHIEILARRKTGPLVYVYRPKLLQESIQQDDVRTFLCQKGYDPSSLSHCIRLLHQRICGTDFQSQLTETCSFPHEIGLFLGYPLEDVIGFIENQGEHFIESGCWKVYSQQRDAQTSFCCYKNCTTIYECMFDGGISIERLANIDETSLNIKVMSSDTRRN